MAEGSRMWAISLLTIMLLTLLSAAPIDFAGDAKKEDDNDGMHSHDENVTRRGKFFGHNQFDVGNINVAGSVAGDVVSIGHEVKIDVSGHTHDHHHREDDTVIECKEGLRELFKSIDSNMNGLMDVKELLRVCHQNNIQITESLAVGILTLPDETVGFNMAKFCELLKDCQSTNSADVIYFLLQPYDKVAGCSRDEIEKFCSCPRDYDPVCAGGRLYNNLCLHECAKKEAECADVQAIPALGDIAECVDPSTKGIVNRDAIKEFQMTLLNIEHELANLVNSRRKRDGLGFTEEQLILLNSIEKGYTYLDIECSNNDGQCHVEKIKGSIEETKSSFTAVKEAGRVSSGFLEHFILERGKFDKIADVAGKVQEKAAVKLPLQGIIVDGGWSAWSSWSDCTGTCGEETRTRTRACSSPAGGKSCPGAATEAESCGLPSCEELVRDVSSCSFDDDDLAEPDCDGQCAFYTTSPFKWENQTIPYYFTSATDKDKELFRSVMDKIEEKTCFKFQEKTEVEYESKHSLEIKISSKSCATVVPAAKNQTKPNQTTGCMGFVYPFKKPYSDNPTRLILKSETHVNDRQDCNCAGFVLHELMHVLGVEHTHARKDRDKYITVNDANVKSSKMTNLFKICENCELNPDVPYDCQSIMHAGSHSDEGLELMTPIDSTNSTTCILSRSAPWLDSSTGSELDWKLLNVIGKCPGTTILIESLEKAGEVQGLALGLYDLMPDKVNNRTAYSQRNGTGFIYHNAENGDWRVGPTLGNALHWLAVSSEEKVPPTDGWKYLDGDKWESDDSTLELTASLFEPSNDCNIIRVESTGASGTSHSSSMDNYTWTDEWLNGRKIYQGGNGHYLRINSSTGHWGIGLSKDGGSSVIKSGFGTTCPCEPENINEKDDWWTYLDADKETVAVTCGGNWGKWSHWSEVDSCDRQCGGGKQRLKKIRSCNYPSECNGESQRIKEKNCAAGDCKCLRTVANFCTEFPQEMSSEEFYTKYEDMTQKFCSYDIEKKRQALLFCDRITPEIAEVLLNAALDSDICNYDTTSILVGDCGQLIRDKVSQNCDETCKGNRTEAQRIIDEVTLKTSEVYEKQIEFQRWVEEMIQKQKDLLEYANKNRDNDVNKQKEIIKTKREEIMKKFEKKMKSDPSLDRDARHKLRVKALYTLKYDTVSSKTITSVNVDLDKAKTKRKKMEKVHKEIKKQWGNVKKNFATITKAEAFVKISQAGGHILSSVKKFEKGGTLNVIGGVLDIATGIGQFLPPPASLVTGTISSIFSMIQGDGAPSLRSTELVIKEEFRKQKEWMKEKFTAIDDQFDDLSTEVKTGFKKIQTTIHQTVEDIRDAIEKELTEQTEEIKSFVLMKAVNEKTREAESHWRALQTSLDYILDNEGTKHVDLVYQTIIQYIDVFKGESDLFEFEIMVTDECKAKSNQAIREYCQTLAFTTLMMYRTNEIILTKTMAMIADSTFNTINYIGELERRKIRAKAFLTEIFTSTDEEKFSYISCGLSEKSNAKLGAEQKKNLLEYADHLDPSLALRKDLEGRESCEDGSYGEEWLPVDGDDITFKKKIEECCKIGKKTEKKNCLPPKNGGVDCDPSVLHLHLRCEGFLSVGYCTAFIRSEKGKICEGDNPVLKEFSEDEYIKSRDGCEEYCSKNDCWGCSVQSNDGMNYKWNALTQCKSIAVWDGKIEGDITQKPGNNIMIPGTVLLKGEFITSPNGENQLSMQDDGNLVLYRKDSWIWASNTEQKCSGCTFHFDISYNLLLKDNKDKIIWEYPKLDVGADALELKDNGTLMLTKKVQYIDHIPNIPVCGGKDSGCCTPTSSCGINDGNCDSDSECKPGLFCRSDNCPKGVASYCCTPSESLKLDASDVPYLLIEKNGWMPICGHYFWDNNIGADIVCQNLGYSLGGVLQAVEGQYNDDAYHVGRCDSRSVTDLESGCAKEGLHENKCKKGKYVSIKVRCREFPVPVLLHTDANYRYYKIPVPASSKMLSALVLTTCTNNRMKPQCVGRYNRISYVDNNCVQTSSRYVNHKEALSYILCSTTYPPSCASTLNMFWYMKDWRLGSACGATKNGGLCATGSYYISTSDLPYFAACVKPVIHGEWTEFSDWGACSKTCGGEVGKKVRSRTCTNPPPSFGGEDCLGHSEEVENCRNVENCQKLRDDGRCGESYPLSNGQPGQCDPNGVWPCCSNKGWCGNSDAHCKCSSCINYADICQNGNGEDYNGIVRKTTSGLYCQKWTSQSPHPHRFESLGNHNYCRNPDGEPGVWCYTTNHHTRWELCDVHVCNEGEGICQNGDGEDYSGSVRKTISGITCQKWTSQSPHSHEWESLGNHNYCRNPDGAPGVWCYTINPDKRWELCDVQVCDKGGG